MRDYISKIKTWWYIGSKKHYRDLTDLRAFEAEDLNAKLTELSKLVIKWCELHDLLADMHKQHVRSLTDQRDMMAAKATEYARTVEARDGVIQGHVEFAGRLQAQIEELSSTIEEWKRSNAALRGVNTKYKNEIEKLKAQL